MPTDRFREFFDAIDQGLCLCRALFDERGRPLDYLFLDVNPAFERESGLADAVGKTALQLVPNLEYRFVDVCCTVARVRQPIHVEQGSRAMGRWFDLYIFPFGDPADLEFGVLFRDATQKRIADERLRAIFETIPVAVWTEDFSEVQRQVERVRAESGDFRVWLEAHPEFIERAFGAVHVIDVNAAAINLLGASSRDELLESLRSVFVREERDLFVEQLVAVAEGEKFLETETLVRTLDGRRLDVIVSVTFPEDGPADRVLLTLIDITAHKLAEESLRESAEALKEADRMKDEFLVTLSHELRTPLTSILGWAQMMTGEDVTLEEMRTGMEAIVRSARAQFALIEDVLDISRITTGKMRLERKMTDLRAVIDAAVDTVRPAAEGKRIELTVEVDRKIGAAAVDADRLQQIVWNLLSNAIKFTPVYGAVAVTAKRFGGEVTIEVRDDGMGIPAAFLPHMFKRFRQADSSSRRAHSGLGIGLALTKELVELHGGWIGVESEEGKGSRFTVTIPVIDGAHDARRPQPSAEVPRRLDGSRILLVEGDDESRAMFSAMLRRNGAEVSAAASVDEALQVFEGFAPTVVVTDIAMPGRDGFDLVTAVRARDHGGVRLPIVAVTAQGTREETSEAVFDRVFAKPLDFDALVDVLGTLKP